MAPEVVNKCFPSAFRGGPSPGAGVLLQPPLGVEQKHLGIGAKGKNALKGEKQGAGRFWEAEMGCCEALQGVVRC